MKDIQTLLSIYNSLADPVLRVRPNVCRSRLFKGCKSNPEFSLKRLQCTLHFVKGNKVNYKMQKDKKETNYSVSIVQR